MPADSNANANTVAEGAAVGTAVAGLTIGATDVNGPAVTYTITADSSGGGFAIDANGVVTVADPSKIDYEQGTHQYTITVEASDGQGGVSSSSFVIDVTNVAPSVPTDGNGATNTVLEGAAAARWSASPPPRRIATVRQ